jgi:hypothetical protein
MGRGLAIAAGLCIGLLMAGLVSAALVTVVRPQLRGVELVWAVTTVTVVATTAAVWRLWYRHKTRDTKTGIGR